MKTCTSCGVEKSLSDFPKRKDAKDGLAYRCKLCNIAKTKKWQAENPERHRASWDNPQALMQARARKYGLTRQELVMHIESHAGVCPICGEKPDKDLVVDHDHETGKVRGLLCNRCNLRLGWVELVGLNKIEQYLAYGSIAEMD